MIGRVCCGLVLMGFFIKAAAGNPSSVSANGMLNNKYSSMELRESGPALEMGRVFAKTLRDIRHAHLPQGCVEAGNGLAYVPVIKTEHSVNTLRDLVRHPTKEIVHAIALISTVQSSKSKGILGRLWDAVRSPLASPGVKHEIDLLPHTSSGAVAAGNANTPIGGDPHVQITHEYGEDKELPHVSGAPVARSDSN